MYTLLPIFTQWSLQNTTVLLRVDYNMTYHNNTWLSDLKIRKTVRTIEYLLQHGASIKLITHQEAVNGTPMSTKPLIRWFTDHGYPILFSPTLTAPVPKNSIMLCENIRFFEGEKSQDMHVRNALAHDLKKNTDYYVFDGFGVAHRADTSTVDAPLLFSLEQRSIGYLVQDELEHLSPLIHAPARPFIAFCAGNKQEKINALKKIKNLDAILLGPALSLNTPASEVVHTPSDYLTNNSAIGPQTTETWSTILHAAKTVLCNGFMGFFETPETLVPFNNLLHAISESDSYSVIAGGSTSSYVDYKKLTEKFNFCSTGGGSTLTYIAYQKLPALDALLLIHGNLEHYL